jgi:hypothetical protein
MVHKEYEAVYFGALGSVVVKAPRYTPESRGFENPVMWIVQSRHYQKKKEWVWNGVHSASWVQQRSYLIEKNYSCL